MGEGTTGVNGQDTDAKPCGTSHGDKLVYQGALTTARGTGDPDDMSTASVGLEEPQRLGRAGIIPLGQGDEACCGPYIPPAYTCRQRLGIISPRKTGFGCSCVSLVKGLP
jgi:hypothetical protein